MRHSKKAKLETKEGVYWQQCKQMKVMLEFGL